MVQLRPMKVPAVIVFIVILVITSTAVVLQSQTTDDTQNAEARLTDVDTDLESANEAATTPFKELTIPYLRTLDYSSQLGELEPYVQRPNYDSYLTSYTSEGLKINALLTVPTGEQPEAGWPAVVFVHGYIPPDVYQTTERYQDYVDYLARNGLVVLKIDLRGHGNSEGEANGAYYSSDYVIDTLSAYQALANSDFVDANRIGLWGHSMAGNVVLRSLAVQPTIPKAVIWAGAVYTYSDWRQYGLSDHSFRLTDLQRSDRAQRRQQLFETHGEFDPNNPFWQQVVPTNYLNDIQTAIQLHHAVDDSVVNVGYSRDLVPLLTSANIEHQLYEYQTGGHNLTGSSFSQAMQRTVEVLRGNQQ